jgi:hypothetical protein
MSTSDYKDEEVEEMCDKIEETLEENGKGDTNTIILGDCNSVTGDKSYKNSSLDHMVKEEEITDVKCSITFVGGKTFCHQHMV